jgi:hypothetical protein
VHAFIEVSVCTYLYRVSQKSKIYIETVFLRDNMCAPPWDLFDLHDLNSKTHDIISSHPNYMFLMFGCLVEPK